MGSGACILMSMAYYIISMIPFIKGGSALLVDPPAVAVIAGDTISLTCRHTTNVFLGWKRGSDYNTGPFVYQAIVYGANNSISSPEMFVDGYLVDNSVGGQFVLIMNNASTARADRYYCASSSYADANVTVLVTKATFSITSLTDEEPVNIVCSISFNGTADASVMITNISGQVVAEKREPGTYPTSTDLRVINLAYISSVLHTYSCQVILTDNSIQIYFEEVNPVLWVSVRNVQIKPAEESRCSKDSKCEINQAINCTADGTPYPEQFQWTVVLNGNQFNKTTSGQLTLASTGNYTVLCTTYNKIGNITYTRSSQYFETEVTVAGPPTPQPVITKDNTPVIVGVVVGVGGGIILIVLAIVIILFIKRKKNRTVCCNPDDKETRNINQAVELSKTQNGSNTLSTVNVAKKNVQITPGVQNKGFEKKLNDEVTLVENDLYSAKSKPQIDPSDGGYASVNEIEAQGK